MEISGTYACIPKCKACREAGLCNGKSAPGQGGMSVRPDEDIILRAPADPHAGTMRLPCGDIGLPWPIVEVFGSGIREIFCDRHGWMRLPKKDVKKVKRDAKVRGTTLFDDIPPF